MTKTIANKFHFDTRRNYDSYGGMGQQNQNDERRVMGASKTWVVNRSRFISTIANPKKEIMKLAHQPILHADEPGLLITNREGLPQPLVDAIRQDDYDAGAADISVTALIGPARIRILKKRCEKVLTEDVSDRIWPLLGKIGHGILQHAAGGGVAVKLLDVRTKLGQALEMIRDGEGSELWDTLDNAYRAIDAMLPSNRLALVEHRFFIQRCGWTVSGQVDYLPNDREIIDYKLVSRFAAKDGPKDEWIQQLNIYRLMAGANGVPVDRLKIVCIFRDWSKAMAARQPHDYPQSQVRVFKLPVWRDEHTEAFLAGRIKAHQDACTTLPECTPEEKWERPAKIALMAKGRKRAVKLYDTQQDAATALQLAGKDHFLEPRQAEWVRCENYCPVSAHCSTFREYWAAKNGESL